MDQFTHLHVHSHYSLLDGMSKVPDLIDKCQRTGMHAMALTDHGNMYGIKDFLDYAKKVNGKASGKVKDCEDNIKKAKEKIKSLSAYETILRDGHWPKEKDGSGGGELNQHDRKDLEQKIADAHKAEKELPLLEEELPKLKAAAEAYIPFKPIVGVEAYCARRSRLMRDKDVKAVNGEGKEFIVDSSGWHLILLAKNMKGYHNLCRMVSLAFIDGFYNRPRIDKELLEEYHEDVICCSACLGGEISQKVLLGLAKMVEGQTIEQAMEAGLFQEAEEAVLWFKNLFGDDYYIELQRHQTERPGGDQMVYQRQLQVNPVLLALARKHQIKYICSNDVHFVEEEHAEAHDRLICLATNHYVDDVNRMHYTKQEWLKTPEEMAAIFPDLPEALATTQEIVDKIVVFNIDSDPIMPLFPIPEEFGTEEQWRQKFTKQELFDEFTRDENGNVVLDDEKAQEKIKKLGGYDRLYRIKFEADYLNKLAWEGAEWRYGEKLHADTPEGKALRDRITFELHIMKTMGFPGYFLIVRDYIRAAREELGVSVGPGRGSAAGSVVAYCLRITDVDPIPYDLLFERFLNPDRISLPDIDVDFDDAGRGKVLDWVSQKYGQTHVAHIITYGTMATKSAIADVGRVQRVPLSEVNRIKSYIPDKGFPDNIKDEKGKTPKVNLKNCYRYVSELREILGSGDENLTSMLHYAGELEDTIRQVGIHACGVIIGADDLTKFAPLATVKDKDTGEDIMVTQYDGHVVENVGLIKMDFLGLITLSIIKEALDLIKKNHGIDIDIDHIPLDDELTYKLFSEGKTIGTFQFESPGMQKYLRELKPTVLPDLIAMNALYRPGPMDYIPAFIRRKNGQEPITYDLEGMDEFLADTYGITVYQEQVMLLSRKLANFTRGESDALRKAMGKKKKDIVDAMKPKFIEGGRKNGHDTAILDKIWGDWEKFASYAFNKSHATCYAWVAYQTGYLKAHYPAEFLAANLTIAKDDIVKVTKFMEECKVMGIKVLPPDVNESELNFTVNHEGNIRFGLGGIKGVGEGAVEAIVHERETNGKYEDIFNFVERVNLSACNRKTVENLATAGAFDCFSGFYREQLLYGTNSKGESVLDSVMRYGNRYQADRQAQQNSLFGMFGDEMAVEITHPELPQVSKLGTIERLNKEKELVGIYLSAHPLDEYAFEVREMCNIGCADLAYFNKWRENFISKDETIRPSRPRTYTPAEGEPDPVDWLSSHENIAFRVGGIITNVELRTARNGNLWGRYALEDYTGKYEFALFGDDYSRYGAMLQPSQYVCLNGVIRQRGSGSKWFKPKEFKDAEYEFALQSIEPLQSMQVNHFQKLVLTMEISKVSPDFNQMLREQCERVTNLIVDTQRKEKEANLQQSQLTRFPMATLEVQIHDALHHNRVRLESKHYALVIDSEFYHFLSEMRDEEIIQFEVK